MSSLGRLEPSLYGDLACFPFFNPAKDQLDWTGGGRGCEHTGWVVVDDVVYSGASLASIDMRIGVRCLDQSE